MGEGTFGLLVLTSRPALWQMILLETVTGAGVALFYPASQALCCPCWLPAAALAIGSVHRTQYGATAIIVAVSGLALIPRDVRRTRTRAGKLPPGEAVLAGERAPGTGAITAGS